MLGADPSQRRTTWRRGRDRLVRPLSGALIAAAVAVAPVDGVAGAANFSCSDAGVLRYGVTAGDSWYGIALRAEIGIGALLDENSAELDDELHPGDVLCLPAGAAIGSTCDPGASRYTVRSGDGWYSIASRAAVTTSSLLAANGADTARALHPGDVLCLPPGASDAGIGGGSGGSAEAAGGRYTVASGDSWFAIARRAGITMGLLLDTNGADPRTVLLSGVEILLPAGASNPGGRAGGESGTYTVASGDSWFAIASAAGVTARALLAVNDVSSSTPLHPGDVIRLPEGADAAALADRGSRTVTLEALPTQGPCWYADTWLAPRANGRRHEGVDFFTPRGQYVYAVVDGTLSGRQWDQPGSRGGNGWWLRAADGSASFFYAHLQDFAPDLEVGTRVQAGQIIGWVGDTGNASAVHLHFEVHPGGGDGVNPYPIVHALGGCNRGTPYTQPSGWVPDPVG